MTTDADGYLTNDRNRDTPPCDAYAGPLVCNLKLRFHSVHHDPATGTWWHPCTVPTCEHGAAVTSRAVQ